MLQPVFDFIEKFATDFNWRRVVIFISIIFFTVVCFYLYEDLTATYELKKYERTVSILKGLEGLEVSSPAEKRVVNNILAGLSGITSGESSGFQIDIFKNESLKLALLSSAPWLLFALVFFPGWLRGDKDSRNSVVGSLLFAAIIGGIGYSLPEDWPNWLRIFGYAVCFNLIVGTFLVKYGNRKKA